MQSYIDFQMFYSRVDSVMLLEEGFQMVSADASDKMLKEAYKIRWERRREESFDKWGKKTYCTLLQMPLTKDIYGT